MRIGALTTHAGIERSAEIPKHVPLLAEAVRHIAHPAIRNRGTLGGSIALADPAAEYPACLVALDATIVLQSKAGERMVRAEEFFKGLFEVDLEPGSWWRRSRSRAAQGRALGVPRACAAPRRLRDRRAGRSHEALRTQACLFRALEQTCSCQAESLEEAKASLPTPAADLYHSPSTKLHLAKVLLERAWNRL